MKETMKQLADLIFKSIHEKQKIKIHDNGFILCPDDQREPGYYGDFKSSSYERISIDKRGRKGKLIRKKHVRCKEKNEYYAISENSFSVPYSVCLKCEHRLPKNDQFKFARCALK